MELKDDMVKGITEEMLISTGRELIKDCNRLAKAVALYLRNKIEIIHVRYLSDKQMRELNPLIRNAVFSYFKDLGEDYINIDYEYSICKGAQYVSNNTIEYLKSQNLSYNTIQKFNEIILDAIGVTFVDIARGAIMLAMLDIYYVPNYWEDCVYNNI